MKDREFKSGVLSIVLKAVVGAAVIGLLFGVIYFLSRPEPEIGGNEEIEVFKTEEGSIDEISVISKTESYTLVKNEGWQMKNFEKLPLSENLAETLAGALENITSNMLVSEGGEDISQYGLEIPSYEVKVTYGEKTETMLVGNKSGDYFYFKLKNDDKVYLVSYDALYLLLSGKNGFLNKVVWSIDQSSIASVALNGITITKDGEGWMETSPYNMTADSDAVTTKILSPISTVKAQEVFSADEKDFEAEIIVTVTTADGERTLSLKKDSGESYLAKTDGSEYVYLVPAANLSFLNVNGFDLISRYIAPISITEVSEIRFTSKDGETVLSIEAPSSEAPVFYKDGVEADETNFRDFYQELMKLTFNEEGEGTGSPERTITFTKENKTVIKIEFLPVSEGDYAVRINGTGSFLIRKKAVSDVFGYLDNIKTIK